MLSLHKSILLDAACVATNAVRLVRVVAFTCCTRITLQLQLKLPPIKSRSFKLYLSLKFPVVAVCLSGGAERKEPVKCTSWSAAQRSEGCAR